MNTTQKNPAAQEALPNMVLKSRDAWVGEECVGMAAFGHPAEHSEAPGTNLAERNSGVGNGNRTRNRRSHSPVLCQLSYSHRRLDYNNPSSALSLPSNLHCSTAS